MHKPFKYISILGKILVSKRGGGFKRVTLPYYTEVNAIMANGEPILANDNQYLLYKTDDSNK